MTELTDDELLIIWRFNFAKTNRQRFLDIARAAIAADRDLTATMLKPVGKRVALPLPEHAPDEHPPSSLDRREVAAWYHGHGCGWQAARAALAEPAAAPAAVAEQPSDDEIMELSEFHCISYTLSDGTVVSPFVEGTDMRSEVLSFARAVLARWGQPPAPPAEGEVAELIKRLKYAKQNGCIPSGISWGLADGSTHHKSTFITAEHGSDCGRAAELLERHAAPVPVPVAAPQGGEVEA